MKGSRLVTNEAFPNIKSALVCEIQRLHSRREPLNLAAVKRSHPDLVSQVFEMRPFWGWIQALRDAGITYDEINIELEDFVDCRICGRSFCQLQYHLKLHGTTVEAYRREFNAEVWSEVFRANVQRRRRKEVQIQGQLPLWDAPWCEEIVLDRIAEYQRQGVSLHHVEMANRDRGLMNYAVRYYGGWDQALRKIGIDPAHVRRQAPSGKLQYPTKTSVLQAIRRRYKKRLPLNFHALLAPVGSPFQRDEGLLKQAIFLFGHWDEAIRQAGLPQQRRYAAPRYTTPKAVLEEIQRRYQKGLPLNSRGLQAGLKEHRDICLYRHGIRFFGSWNRAMAEAGLPPQTLYCRGGRYPTPEAVIQEIRRRILAGLPINAYQVHAGSQRDSRLLTCGIRHFGKWSKALEAAAL